MSSSYFKKEIYHGYLKFYDLTLAKTPKKKIMVEHVADFESK